MRLMVIAAVRRGTLASFEKICRANLNAILNSN
jgi:hypothetical protein